MTATYTFDVFSSLDDFGAATGDWTGYWGKQGPELLDQRFAEYGAEQRMVFGANTYRALMAAGLVDRVQVTLFPVITGQTGADPVFGGAADFDLELLERRTLDGDI